MTDSTTTSLLKVEVTSGPAPTSIRVHVQNTDPKHTISFLTWDSPLDPSAINTGILILENARTGEAIPGPEMKVNRLLPPPREDLVELAPGATTSRDLALIFPWIPTDGTHCRVRMRGTWRAIWSKSAEQVTDDELATVMGEQRPALFDSGSIEMTMGG